MNEERELLRDAITRQLKAMQGMEVGTDEYKSAVDSLTKMVDRKNEIDKIDLQYHQQNDEKKQHDRDYGLKKRQLNQEIYSRERELKLREQQMAAEKKDRRIQHSLTIVSLGTNVVLVVWGVYKTFKFEETGTVTSPLGRGFINMILPKKR